MSSKQKGCLPGSPFGRLLCRLVPVMLVVAIGSAMALFLVGSPAIFPLAVLSSVLMVWGMVYEARHEAPGPGEYGLY